MALWGREDDVLDVFVVSYEPIGNTREAFSGRCWLLGVTATEPGGVNPALVKFVDGGDANGQPIGRLAVAAGATVVTWPGFPGLPCRSGLFINMINGSLDLYLTIGRWVKANARSSV